MAQMDKGSELRQLKRRHLIYYLEVYDLETGELLGHLVDLTIKGMKLVSKNKIPTGKNFALKMIMPEEYCTEREVRFSAVSAWCRQDVNPDFYATGFNTPDLDDVIRRIFMIMINQIGFND